MELVLQRPQRKESVKRYTILYVDDEPVNLRIFQHAFKRDYNVHTALNGFDALDIMKQNTIDLIVTDQQMPRMSGVDLLAKVVPSNPDIVRMIMTGFSDIGAIIRAVNEFGLDKYLVKPWDRDQLKGEFDKALDKQSKKINEKNKSKSNESVVKLNHSLLPEMKDLKKSLLDCFIVYDGTDTNNCNYWFGESDGKLVVTIFNAKEKNNVSITLNSFINLNLTELVFKDNTTEPDMLLQGLARKIHDRYQTKNKDEKIEVNIAVIQVDNKKRELKFSGCNQDFHFFSGERSYEKIEGETNPLSTDKSRDYSTIIKSTDDILAGYLISKSLIKQTLIGKDGKKSSFVNVLSKMQKMPLDMQSEVVSKKFTSDKTKCILGMKFKAK